METVDKTLRINRQTSAQESEDITRYIQTNIHFIIVQVTTFTGSPLSDEVLEAVAVKMLGKAEVSPNH